MTSEAAEATGEPSNLIVDLQVALEQSADVAQLPTPKQIQDWASKAYAVACQQLELPATNEVTIRFVDAEEITELNASYRGKNKPTNVLSFPFEVPPGMDVALLGDIVVCHQIVVAEAQKEGKTLHQHYTHMITHGILHLCGYDHQCDDTAEEMEALEVQILELSDLPNPYI